MNTKQNYAERDVFERAVNEFVKTITGLMADLDRERAAAAKMKIQRELLRLERVRLRKEVERLTSELSSTGSEAI
jgi:hypothetical protein